MPEPTTRPVRTVFAGALALVLLTACEQQHVAAPPAIAAVPSLVPATSLPQPAESTQPTERAVEAAPRDITYPESGSAEWQFAPAGDGHVAGRSGRLLRYRVAVENDIGGVDPAEFATEVDTILDDPKGWTAGGTWRLQRVEPGGPVDFTIFLATPTTRDGLCGGRPDGYTSCRNGNNVVLNVARWANAVPGYGASLSVYRQYMVTHEVGHRLGEGHQLCPGAGQPAPVMQQQTLGLHGCTPNPWPYPDGRLYAGPQGEYNDPIPA